MADEEEIGMVCEECFMPLQGGVCPYDPEHTSTPEDLSDPDIPEWYFSWLHIYQGRDAWPFSVFTALPPISDEVRGLAPSGALGLAVSPLEAVDRRRRLEGASSRWRDCFRELEITGLDDLYAMDGSRGHELVPRSLSRPPGMGMATMGSSSPSTEQLAIATLAGGGAAARPAQAVCGARRAEVAAWLKEVDHAGAMDCYGEAISCDFGSPEEIAAVYVRKVDGKQVIDPNFFERLGVRKLGHKRLFEKWFAEHL